jgi:hypothetical protein
MVNLVEPQERDFHPFNRQPHQTQINFGGVGMKHLGDNRS